MTLPRSQRGIPRLSHDQETLKYMAQLSEPFGTKMVIKDDFAYVEINN